MQTTLLKKRPEDTHLEKTNVKDLIHDGALQVRMTLQALREGKVKIFDPVALKRSKIDK